MYAYTNIIYDLFIILLLIGGISQFRSPRSARTGNMTAALAMLFAMALVLYRYPATHQSIVAAGLIVGAVFGIIVALRVTMIQIPSMVAFQHGAGGVAAFIVAFVELTRESAELTTVGEISGYLGLFIGAATFSGSMLASGKLAGKLKQTPQVLPQHNTILVLLVGIIAALCVASRYTGAGIAPYIYSGVILLSAVLGVVFSMRIGGADMPVLISFLNATAGLAAAFCGIVIQNRLLIACGATVAASGSILTAVMCRGMNRGIGNVFTGTGSAKGKATDALAIPKEVPQLKLPKPQEAMSRARTILGKAKKVIIIPGYGMALAKAQFKVADLAKILEKRGAEVKFAIHPVAGRMPGHMNVLLAEAEIDYDKLKEMDDVNSEFSSSDVVLVVGACDVVNPEAIKTEGTPISGMPILKAYEAKNVLVCNLDQRPGYSGVENTLYHDPKTVLLFGDAAKTISELSAE